MNSNMIESEEKRKRLIDILERWSKYIKIEDRLRPGDLPGLVNSILGEFYHIHLCCGHMIKDFNEEVVLEFEDVNTEGNICTVVGAYCKECAKKYLKTMRNCKDITNDYRQ